MTNGELQVKALLDSVFSRQRKVLTKDWTERHIKKLNEEMREFRTALRSGDKEQIALEGGDVAIIVFNILEQITGRGLNFWMGVKATQLEERRFRGTWPKRPGARGE